MRISIAGLTLGMLCASAGVATAQERDASDWRLSVGAGAIVSPSYEGDDEVRLSIVPDIRVAYGDRFFASVQEGIGYRAVLAPNLQAGPIARVKFGREESGEQTFALSGDDSDDLVGLGDVDTSLELGGFVQYALGPMLIEAEARQGVSGHEGFVADIGLRWRGQVALDGSILRYGLGPRVRLVDDDYVSAYFDVDAAQSAASGLAVFDADGGLYSYGIGANAVWRPNGANPWSLGAFASIDRLSGDAGDSSLVRARGEATQVSGGVFVSRALF